MFDLTLKKERVSLPKSRFSIHCVSGKWGPLLIRLVGNMFKHVCGQFWLDKTVDHISDMQCDRNSQ